MSTQEFEVIAPGIPHTRQEFIEAMLLPVSELPDLSERDRQHVEQFKLNVETSRRFAEAKRKAAERERTQGQALCATLQMLLDTIGSSCRIKSAQRVSGPEGWFVRLEGEAPLHMSLEMETVVQLLDGSATQEEMDIFVGQLSDLVSAPVRRSVRG